MRVAAARYATALWTHTPITPAAQAASDQGYGISRGDVMVIL